MRTPTFVTPLAIDVGGRSSFTEGLISLRCNVTAINFGPRLLLLKQ